jgi:hypothetical protein
VILTTEIPTLEKGEPYSFPIEAEDDTTPVEFLPWAVDYEVYYYYGFDMSMEGNILKGGPYWDLESDIFLTITVWDEAGDSTSRDYQMNINWENEPPVILKHPDKLTTEGRYLYLTVGDARLDRCIFQ